MIYALSLLEEQRRQSWRPRLRELLEHPEPEVRRRALALLSADGDRAIASTAEDMLRDPDAGVRTEALLYLSRELGVDPLAKIQELGDFPDFSIRAAMAAFLASPGPSRNLEATRVIVEQMINSTGPTECRIGWRRRACWRWRPTAWATCSRASCATRTPRWRGMAIAGARLVRDDQVLGPLIELLGRPELAEEAADALSRHGTTIVPRLKERLLDDSVSLDVRREIPLVLLRIGTPEAGRALVDALMEGDATAALPGHRLAQQAASGCIPSVSIDRRLVELLLAAEIAGHYRSHQVLGALRRRCRRTIRCSPRWPIDGARARADLPADVVVVPGRRSAGSPTSASSPMRLDHPRQLARVPRQRAAAAPASGARAGPRSANLARGSHRDCGSPGRRAGDHRRSRDCEPAGRTPHCTRSRPKRSSASARGGRSEARKPQSPPPATWGLGSERRSVADCERPSPLTRPPPSAPR